MRRRVGESLHEFRGVRPVTVEAHAIDEKGWSAVHSTADTAAEVIANSLDVSASRQLARYALWIDPDLGRIGEKIRVLQRRAYGLRDEEYLRLKVLTCMLPAL